jgi:hypothetical protein
MLLIGAGLMLRSFVKLMEVNPGFRTDHLLAMRMTPNFSKYTQNASQIPTLMDSITRHLKAINGVESVTLVSAVPLSPAGIAMGPGNNDFRIFGRTLSPGELAPTVDLTERMATTFLFNFSCGRLMVTSCCIRIREVRQAMAKSSCGGRGVVGEFLIIRM